MDGQDQTGIWEKRYYSMLIQILFKNEDTDLMGYTGLDVTGTAAEASVAWEYLWGTTDDFPETVVG